MTIGQLAGRILLTWLSVTAFAYLFFAIAGDHHGSQVGRAVAAGLIVAMCTAPAYYHRFLRNL